MCAAGARLLSIISAALSRSKATQKCFVYCLKSKALPVCLSVWVRSKGEAGTIAAALTVRVERTPFSESEQAAPPPQDEEGRHEGEL